MWQWEEPWKRGTGYQGLDVLAEIGQWSWSTSCLVLSNILSGFFLLKHHQQPWPVSTQGFCCSAGCVAERRGRELKEMGRD